MFCYSLTSMSCGPKCSDCLNCLHILPKISFICKWTYIHTFICNNGTFFCLVYLFLVEGKERRRLKQCLVSASSTFPRIMLHSLYIIMEGPVFSWLSWWSEFKCFFWNEVHLFGQYGFVPCVSVLIWKHFCFKNK